jgi:tripartite-type tricarboxylate transporter receptor subunit TctC
MFRRDVLAGCVAAAGMALRPGQGMAQEAAAWPSRPVTILVPYGPGGASDLVARAIAQRMQPALGRPVVAENRPGANGEIASRQLARSAPDGHTILLGAIGVFAINPALRPNLGYDPQRDFTAITLAVTSPNVLVVNPQAVEATDLAGVIAWLKREAGRTAYSTSGIGSSHHLTMEAFKQLTGTDPTHVPYAGGGAAVTALLSGTVQLAFLDLGVVAGQIADGRLRPIIMTSAERDAVLPQVPTAAEAGLADFVATSWQGVAGPANMPEPLLKRVHGAVAAALREPEVVENLRRAGLTVVANEPAEFAAFQAREIARWKQVVQRAGIRAE